MKILGADLSPLGTSATKPRWTLALLDDVGEVSHFESGASLPEVAAAVGRLADNEPFLLGLNLPLVVPAKPTKARPVENLVRRRFGYRLPAGGRATLASLPGGIPGDALLAGLAAAGHPCVPFPDRDGRRSGLAETYPGLVLKSLLWQSTRLGTDLADERRQDLFRAYPSPRYRSHQLPAKTAWMERAGLLDQVVRAVESVPGYSMRAVIDALRTAQDEAALDLAAGLFDAILIASTVRRYIDDPERCLFAGDAESGYVILPADDFIRGLGVEVRTAPARLFPRESLRERLAGTARLRPAGLLDLPGQPARLEAQFETLPEYEFDNLDEMVWWKHCRHLRGPTLPTEGLQRITLRLTAVGQETLGAAEALEGGDLHLIRSRHRTLSYRFDPPESWRKRVPTRDGRTYGFEVLRAQYETLAQDD